MDIEKGIKVGLFTVKKYGVKEKRIKVELSGASWNMSFSEATETFAFIDYTAIRGSVEVLEMLFLMWYQNSTAWFADEQFLIEFHKSYLAMIERVRGAVEVTKEEDDKILEELQRVHNSSEDAAGISEEQKEEEDGGE